MNAEIVLRVISLCVALASAETLHGIARTLILAPQIGKQRALKWSIVSGSLLAFAVCWLLVPGMGLTTATDLVGVGLVLALFMAGFDIALARLLLKLSWSKVLRDFDPRSGNYLSFGLVLLIAFPYLVMKL